jgi:predicted secreted hydrolase
MRRSHFVLGTAAMSALPLAGCAPSGGLFSARSVGDNAAGAAFARTPRYFAEGSKAAESCPLGSILSTSLNSISKNYPQKGALALMKRVAASKNISAPQVLVSNALLGPYSAIGNVPKPNHPLVFPADHGEHFDTTYEWRYITLSLPLKGGGLVSVVMAFFRTALLAPDKLPSLQPIERQIYSTSVGVTLELPGRPGVHYAWPITALSGCDVTYTNSPFKMVLGKNYIQSSGNNVFPLHLHLEDPGDWSVGQPPVVIDVDCAATNPLFLQGTDGYVGANVEDPDLAWYYYSWPQQKTTGSVTWGNTRYQVGKGAVAWMDHQWGGIKQATSGPINDGGGWSWFEFQFPGNQSLTLAAPHGPIVGGKLPLFNAGFGTYVDGTDAFPISAIMQVLGYTQSPTTTAMYPTDWRVQVLPGAKLSPIALVIEPTCTVVPQALWMNGIVEYAEANCTAVAQGSLNGKGVTMNGVGFCESVGFEDPKQRLARQIAYLKSSLA